MPDHAFGPRDWEAMEWESIHGSDPDEDWWAKELTPGYADEAHGSINRLHRPSEMDEEAA